MENGTQNGPHGKHSEEFLRARQRRAEGVSKEEARAAIERLGEPLVRELVGPRRGTLARLVRAAEGIGGATGVERSERDAYITLAACEFAELRSLVGADRGEREAERPSGGSDCYRAARERRARGVSEAELRRAVAELGEARVRELLARPRFGAMVRRAEEAGSEAGREAYLCLAASEWSAARRAVGMEVDAAREERGCAAWARRIAESAEGVSPARLREAVGQMGRERARAVVDGPEPLFAAAVRRAARAGERSERLAWVRLAASGSERVRAILGRQPTAGRSRLCASVPRGVPPAPPEVRVVRGRARREIALSALGAVLSGAVAVA